jgi:mono/diheme cytochrome c family protein
MNFRRRRAGSTLLAVGAATSLLPAIADAAPASGGARLFEANCQVCHQAQGVGVGGQYPRLKGRAPAIAATPAGRAFLSQLVLSGMSGTVSVDGQRIIGIMPGFAQLPDADLAAVLTYVSSLGPDKKAPAPFKPAEIAAARAAARPSPNQMASTRNLLADQKVVP